jgi:hypothetical protein
VQILDVTAHGRAASNHTSNGLSIVGSVDGTLRAKVRWPGTWLTDGDPAALEAQKQQVKALFPDIEITDITVTPVVS